MIDQKRYCALGAVLHDKDANLQLLFVTKRLRYALKSRLFYVVGIDYLHELSSFVKVVDHPFRSKKPCSKSASQHFDSVYYMTYGSMDGCRVNYSVKPQNRVHHSIVIIAKNELHHVP